MREFLIAYHGYGLAFIIGYFLGSIPFGLIITKLAGQGDVRDIGSGSIGATNVLRTGSKKLAAATLIADVAKGAIAVSITLYFAATMNFDMFYVYLTAFFALTGHMFPVWLKFKGGKGVATYIGIFLVAAPWAVLVFAITWLSTAYLTRYSSLAALLACSATTIYLWLGFTNADWAVPATILTATVILKHHENIKRLLNGEESKIGDKS
ncbi:MAG: glycerol-3-phosphate 1-O-acyltransferase PlsY [Rhizobiales bacterium]|nr:glycerol-3-phosphate 1-O-acyltransferase PlsY [Hyphomicrobiales bacterium]NRB14872.1 glycerol-3-phosphate 1-O-acyltransferase PlsY [Hyphomicrobiales bacterium]